MFRFHFQMLYILMYQLRAIVLSQVKNYTNKKIPNCICNNYRAGTCTCTCKAYSPIKNTCIIGGFFVQYNSIGYCVHANLSCYGNDTLLKGIKLICIMISGYYLYLPRTQAWNEEERGPDTYCTCMRQLPQENLVCRK